MVHPGVYSPCIVNADEEGLLRRLMELVYSRGRVWGRLIDTRDAWQVQPGSSLAEDDVRTAPYHLSHSAWHALTVGVDHFRCLHSSLAGEIRGNMASIQIHSHAQFSLVRGAIENSARAVWMLGPTDRVDRVSHRLALEVMELNPSYRLLELVRKRAPRTKDERYEQLRQMAIAAEVQEADVNRVLNSARYFKIVREAGALISIGADFAEVVWRGCSALAHGDIAGTLALVDREEVARSDGVTTVRMTGSIGVMYAFADTAATMIDRGFTLYQQAAR